MLVFGLNERWESFYIHIVSCKYCFVAKYSMNSTTSIKKSIAPHQNIMDELIKSNNCELLTFSISINIQLVQILVRTNYSLSLELCTHSVQASVRQIIVEFFRRKSVRNSFLLATKIDSIQLKWFSLHMSWACVYVAKIINEQKMCIGARV